MICAVIARKSFSEILSLLPRFSLAEIRLDLLTLTPDETARIFLSHPGLIATYRKSDSVSDSTRLDTLRRALENGAWAADIDVSDPSDFASAVKAHQRRLILSFHDNDKTPPDSELEKTLLVMKRRCPDIIKMAAYAHSSADMLRLLSFYSHPRLSGSSLILLSMGPRGILSRIGAPLLGAPFTYAAADESSGTAPGQLTVSRMESLFSLLEMNDPGKGDRP